MGSEHLAIFLKTVREVSFDASIQHVSKAHEKLERRVYTVLKR